MNTCRDCLVIIDVQKGFLSEETRQIPKRIEALLQKRTFAHVVGTQFINEADSPFCKLMGWNGLMDAASQQVDAYVESVCERIFVKKTYSCFTEEFEKYLKENQIEKLYFVGIDTDCCVLQSATDCFESNLPFEVLLYYCASNGGAESEEAALRVMRRTIGTACMNSLP